MGLLSLPGFPLSVVRMDPNETNELSMANSRFNIRSEPLGGVGASEHSELGDDSEMELLWSSEARRTPVFRCFWASWRK